MCTFAASNELLDTNIIIRTTMTKSRLLPLMLVALTPWAAMADDDSSSSETVEQVLRLSTGVSNSTGTTITFSDDNVVITLSDGTTTQVLEDVTLQFSYGSVSVDETSESNTLSAKESTTLNTTRTISNRYWNTLVLPFDMDSTAIADTFGEGTEVAEFTSATASYLKFTSVSSITGGTPFIIKPANTVTNPEFKAVDVSTTMTDVEPIDGYTFKGLYDKTTWQTTNDTILYISTDGTFKTLAAGGSIKGLRGYFKLADAATAKSLAFGLVDEETGETTAITSIDGVTVPTTEAVYSISGQYMGTSLADLPKGIYITNGKKVLVK